MGDFGDANGGVRLPVAAQLLVLLLALVMENQNFRAAAFLHYLADHASFCQRLAHLAFGARYRQNVGERYLAVGSRGKTFHSNYVSGRHSVLLSTGADHRVHTPASIKIS